jgi:hypothetical protein
MNKTLNTFFAAMLLASCASAFAASSVDLSVTGTITPSACTPTLSSGGVVDYGKISAKDLNADEKTFLVRQTVQLTLTCAGPTFAAIAAKDNREGSDFNNDYTEFGLGLINASEKLGGMELFLRTPLADGVPVRIIGSADDGSTWLPEPYLTRTNMLTVANTGTQTPISMQTLSADLHIDSFIAPTNQLTLNNEVAIDGSVTLSVVYL